MLGSLATTGFRNLEDQIWQPAPGRNVLLGDNGTGKTSLLEAVYLALTTKSFRCSQLSDCVRHGESLFHLAADLCPFSTRLEVSWANGKLRHLVNGKPSTLGDHLGSAAVLPWTSAESDLLTGAPELRRRFVDRVLVGAQPKSLEVLSRYRRVLAQKRIVLAAGAAGLEPWNELLVESGAQLIDLRSAAVASLRSALAEVVAASDLPFRDLELRYQPNPKEGEDGKLALASAITRHHQDERRRRVALVGPHRDDLVLLWRGRELRRAVSAGERKALGMALVAAQGRVLRAAGRAPIFLLDDADAELDRAALGRVWSAFPGDAQILASSNRPEVWSPSQADGFWRVSRGRAVASEHP